MKYNNKGLAAIEIVIIMLIVGIVCFIFGETISKNSLINEIKGKGQIEINGKYYRAEIGDMIFDPNKKIENK